MAVEQPARVHAAAEVDEIAGRVSPREGPKEVEVAVDDGDTEALASG